MSNGYKCHFHNTFENYNTRIKYLRTPYIGAEKVKFY